MSASPESSPRTLGRLGRLAVWAIALALLGAWIGVAVTFGLVEEQRPRVIALGFALFATELTFWAVALLLGLKVAQARRLIWAKIKSAFSTGRRPPAQEGG